MVQLLFVDNLANVAQCSKIEKKYNFIRVIAVRPIIALYFADFSDKECDFTNFFVHILHGFSYFLAHTQFMEWSSIQAHRRIGNNQICE